MIGRGLVEGVNEEDADWECHNWQNASLYVAEFPLFFHLKPENELRATEPSGPNELGLLAVD